MKNLHLDRPIVLIDLETTGLSTGSDRIVELTALKVYPDGRVAFSDTSCVHRSRKNTSLPRTVFR